MNAKRANLKARTKYKCETNINTVFLLVFKKRTQFWATFYLVAFLNICNELQGGGGVGCHLHIHSGFGWVEVVATKVVAGLKVVSVVFGFVIDAYAVGDVVGRLVVDDLAFGIQDSFP